MHKEKKESTRNSVSNANKETQPGITKKVSNASSGMLGDDLAKQNSFGSTAKLGDNLANYGMPKMISSRLIEPQSGIDLHSKNALGNMGRTSCFMPNSAQKITYNGNNQSGQESEESVGGIQSNKIFTEKFKRGGRNGLGRPRSNSAIIIGAKNYKIINNDEQWISAIIKFYSEHIIPNLGQSKASMKETLWEYYEELKTRKDQLQKKITNRKFMSKKKNSASTLTVFGSWGGTWEQKKKMIKKNSPHSNFQTLVVRAFVCKAADDMRQEMLALQ